MKDSPSTEQDNIEQSSIMDSDEEGSVSEQYQISSESITTLHRNINATIRQVGPESNMAVTNQGMYYVERTELGDGYSAYKMLFFDFATEENVVVCSNASCLHQDRDCEAIYAPEVMKETDEGELGNVIRVSPLGVYDNKLYVMVSEKQDNMICLYRSEMSGHNREVIWKVSYPGKNVENRMIIADSVIWNDNMVYVNYYSEDHFAKKLKVFDEETQMYLEVNANYIANLGNGILCVDVTDTKGPVQICEERAEFFFEEKDTGEMEMYLLDRGYVVMMAAKDNVVYYRHVYTEEVLEWEQYIEDEESYRAQWNETRIANVVQVEVQAGQVNVQQIFSLDGGRTEFYDDNIYYTSQGQVWKYDLTTKQQEMVVELFEGTELEGVIGEYLILRNYTDQKMYFMNLETMDVVSKEMEIGSNLYGQITYGEEEFWFFRATGWGSDGERSTQWYLTSPQDYLTSKKPQQILVYQRAIK